MKSISTLQAAIEERDELKSEIASDPRVKRLELLEDIIAKLGGVVEQKAPVMGKTSGDMSSKDRARELTFQLLRQQGNARLGEIYKYITTHGLKISEGTLKAYLYKMDGLKAHRTKGFMAK